MTLGNDNGTDGQTDRRTDRVRRNMRPPPREEGRIIMLGNQQVVFFLIFFADYCVKLHHFRHNSVSQLCKAVCTYRLGEIDNFLMLCSYAFFDES